MTEQQQIQAIVNSLQNLADRLSMDGHLLDAAQAVAGLQTIRALNTRLNPPKPAEPLELVPGGTEKARLNPDGTAWVGGPPEEPAKEPTRLESV